MKKKTTLSASLILAGALALGAPAVAMADAYPVPTPSPNDTIPAAPGQSVDVAFSGFAAGETVTFTLTGENASGATLASIVRLAVEAIDLAKTADSSGAVAVNVTLPADATGTYTLTATGSTSGIVQTVLIETQAPAPGEGEEPDDDSDLSPTGTDGSTFQTVLIGGGALALTGGAIVAATAIRRRRA